MLLVPYMWASMAFLPYMWATMTFWPDLGTTSTDELGKVFKITTIFARSRD